MSDMLRRRWRKLIFDTGNRSAIAGKAKVKIDQPDLKDMQLDDDEHGERAQAEKVQIADLVHKYLSAQKLGVLPEWLVQHAVEDFVEKNDKDALKEQVMGSRGKTSLSARNTADFVRARRMLKKSLKHGRKDIDDDRFKPDPNGHEYDNLTEFVSSTTGLIWN